jgi:hypothetical protein
MDNNQGIIVSGGTLTGRQLVVGSNAQATYTEAAPADAPSVDIVALRAALKQLRADLARANLDDDTLIAAQTSAGQALVEGLKDERVEPAALEQHIRRVGATLKESNVAVQQGSELWTSIQKLLPLLAPVVGGGARAAAAWFGIPI